MTRNELRPPEVSMGPKGMACILFDDAEILWIKIVRDDGVVVFARTKVDRSDNKTGAVFIRYASLNRNLKAGLEKGKYTAHVYSSTKDSKMESPVVKRVREFTQDEMDSIELDRLTIGQSRTNRDVAALEKRIDNTDNQASENEQRILGLEDEFRKFQVEFHQLTQGQTESNEKRFLDFETKIKKFNKTDKAVQVIRKQIASLLRSKRKKGDSANPFSVALKSAASEPTSTAKAATQAADANPQPTEKVEPPKPADGSPETPAPPAGGSSSEPPAPPPAEPSATETAAREWQARLDAAEQKHRERLAEIEQARQKSLEESEAKLKETQSAIEGAHEEIKSTVQTAQTAITNASQEIATNLGKAEMSANASATAAVNSEASAGKAHEAQQGAEHVLGQVKTEAIEASGKIAQASSAFDREAEVATTTLKDLSAAAEQSATAHASTIETAAAQAKTELNAQAEGAVRQVTETQSQASAELKRQLDEHVAHLQKLLVPLKGLPSAEQAAELIDKVTQYLKIHAEVETPTGAKAPTEEMLRPMVERLAKEFFEKQPQGLSKADLEKAAIKIIEGLVNPEDLHKLIDERVDERIKAMKEKGELGLTTASAEEDLGIAALREEVAKAKQAADDAAAKAAVVPNEERVKKLIADTFSADRAGIVTEISGAVMDEVEEKLPGKVSMEVKSQIPPPRSRFWLWRSITALAVAFLLLYIILGFPGFQWSVEHKKEEKAVGAPGNTGTPPPTPSNPQDNAFKAAVMKRLDASDERQEKMAARIEKLAVDAHKQPEPPQTAPLAGDRVTSNCVQASEDGPVGDPVEYSSYDESEPQGQDSEDCQFCRVYDNDPRMANRGFWQFDNGCQRSVWVPFVQIRFGTSWGWGYRDFRGHSYNVVRRSGPARGHGYGGGNFPPPSHNNGHGNSHSGGNGHNQGPDPGGNHGHNRR